MSSNIKLVYFPAWGRAGAIRAALKLGKVPFDDVKLPFSEFAKERVSHPDQFPLGQMPVLTVDGVVHTQSSAMLRWAGKKSGLYPTDDLQALLVDEAIALVEDVLTSAPQDPDAAVKKTKREEWTVAKLPKYLNRLQFVIEKNNGPYYLGGSLSIADLAVFGLVHGLKSGTYDYVPLDTVDKWPTLVTLYEKVKANPVVAGELPVAV